MIYGDAHIWNSVDATGSLYLGSTKSAGKVWYDNNNTRVWLTCNSINGLSVESSGIAIARVQLKVGVNGYTTQNGDIGAARDSAPTTGVIYLGNSGSKYLFFDGSAYQLVNASLNLSAGAQYTINGVPIGGGGVTTQNVVTGSRANNTVYQNTTGKPMFVTVAENYTGANNFSANSDSSSNPTTIVAWSATAVNGANAGISFWVLPNNYYKVVTSGHTLIGWTEWY